MTIIYLTQSFAAIENWAGRVDGCNDGMYISEMSTYFSD